MFHYCLCTFWSNLLLLLLFDFELKVLMKW